MSDSRPEVVEEPPKPRIIGQVTGRDPGPTLICIGSLHGNEHAGHHALIRVARALVDRSCLRRGEFFALTGNVTAFIEQRRFIDRDLNRDWRADRVAAVRHHGPRLLAEDTEQVELLNLIGRASERARGDMYLLDLHTVSGTGAPFVALIDTMSNRALARAFGIPIILGFEEHMAGTFIDYATNRGYTAVAVEGGQHDEASSIDHLEAAVWVCLEAAGLVRQRDCPGVTSGKRLLRRRSRRLPRWLEIRYRHGVSSTDGFTMHAGFASFEPVAEGQILGRDNAGEVHTPHGGLLLMPLYQRQGDDGFFIARRVKTMWHWLSQVHESPAPTGSFTGFPGSRTTRASAMRSWSTDTWRGGLRSRCSICSDTGRRT